MAIYCRGGDGTAGDLIGVKTSAAVPPTLRAFSGYDGEW